MKLEPSFVEYHPEAVVTQDYSGMIFPLIISLRSGVVVITLTTRSSLLDRQRYDDFSRRK
jgi:hypothetical protein